MSSGYICQFNDLQIKSVLLDEVMKVSSYSTHYELCHLFGFPFDMIGYFRREAHVGTGILSVDRGRGGVNLPDQ